VFDAKAGASLTAQAVMVGEVNTALAWQADSMAASLGYKDAAGGSAAAAASSATAADGAVVSAQAQVGLAADQAHNAAASASSAQVSASAAGAAAGMPSLSGNGKKALTIKADESGVEWKAIGQLVGDILISATPPSTNYLPAANVYLQSAYPALFSKLGTSTNLELTSPQIKTMPATFSAIAYGAGKFVGVSYNGSTIYYSADGINWSSVILPGGGNSWVSYVCFANDRFFAFSPSTAFLATSQDGVSWTSTTTGVTGPWRSLVYANGLYVAGGGQVANQAILTSPDGIAWTLRGTPAAGTAINSIFYAFGLFIALPSNSTSYLTSPDGIVWTLRTTPFFSGEGQSAAFGNGVIVSSCSPSSAGSIVASGSVMRSVDGINWTVHSLPQSAYWVHPVYVAGKFVVVANDMPLIGMSGDGVNWINRPAFYTRAFNVVVASPSLILAASTAEAIYLPCYSYDPITQFATPLVPVSAGTKAYIKYQE
jgi:hypothetical protein